MLSAAVLLFSSCLGDSDYTPSYGGLGTPLGDMSSSVMLDDGVTVMLNNISATELMNIDRIFVYGQLASGYEDIEQVQKGDKIAIVPQYALVLDEVEELQLVQVFLVKVVGVDAVEYDCFPYRRRFVAA